VKTTEGGPIAKDLATLFQVGAMGGLEDVELLSRFVSRREEAAFAAIVERHGPMVLATCRRRLGDRPEADDAFQAVFMVLCRRADSLWIRGSLGPWLHAVALRVTQRAKAAMQLTEERFRPLAGQEAIDPMSISNRDADDLRRVIDEEIARLPARARSAVVLCLLQGLSREQAAKQLRCPVGTVDSRLSRARQRLQRGLVRRGIAPAAGLISLTSAMARAEVSPGLISTTFCAAAKLASGATLASTVPVGVALWTTQTLRRMVMIKGLLAGILVTLGAAMAGGVGLAVAHSPAIAAADETPTAKPQKKENTEPKAIRPPTPADRYEAIVAEWEAARERASAETEKGTNDEERSRLYVENSPDLLAFTDRMLALAQSEPTDPVARDALLWVIYQPGMMAGQSPVADRMMLAAAMLTTRFGDDPDAIRVGLEIDREVSREHDLLIEAFAGKAKSHEAKGLAKFALAQYLTAKAIHVEHAQKRKGPLIVRFEVTDASGKKVMKEGPSPWDDAYESYLRMLNPMALQAEAERLYEEVIADFADIPFVRHRTKLLERKLRELQADTSGDPEKKATRERLEALLARRKTLGEVAAAKLDEMHNLVAGRPAPEIDGVDLDGKPLKLSDYRGKVVALVFWATWCGPCMREIPHERELVERMKGRPFALLGVNVDHKPEEAKKAVESEKITWPNWFDGMPDTGPIVKKYHVRGYPTVILIDSKGIIRNPTAHPGESLDKLVDDLVAETEK
jgi:RNA polymerase sigma factor (sigma-70 family)